MSETVDSFFLPDMSCYIADGNLSVLLGSFQFTLRKKKPDQAISFVVVIIRTVVPNCTIIIVVDIIKFL